MAAWTGFFNETQIFNVENLLVELIPRNFSKAGESNLKFSAGGGLEPPLHG